MTHLIIAKAHLKAGTETPQMLGYPQRYQDPNSIRGRLMNYRFVTALLWIHLVLCTGQSRAEILIDNLHSRVDYVTAFGDPNSAFYAQTFIAPAGPLGKLTLEFLPITLEPVHFRLLLTEVGDALPFVPSTIVFESGRQIVPPAPVPSAFSINLQGTTLNAGQKYAFILDGYTDRDGIISQLGVGVNSGKYSGGIWYHQNWGSTFTDPRDELMALAGHWWVRPTEDLTFRLESAVPEPSTAIVAVVFFAAAASARRIRFK